jgi:CheY-like chemotaxis protein
MSDNQIEKVLMVDDDANIRLITEMSLKKLTKWHITVAASGHEALQAAEKDAPDLILLDMMMPQMDGLTVFSELKTKLGDDMPKVILMTAKVQAHEVDHYKQLGAAGIISKPFDPMTLPDQIRAIVNSEA